MAGLSKGVRPSVSQAFLRHVVLSVAHIDSDAKERKPMGATISSSASSGAAMPCSSSNCSHPNAKSKVVICSSLAKRD